MATAVAQLHDPTVPPMPQPLQSALFPADELHAVPLDANRQAELRKRGPGRPPNSINKSTAAWRDYILGRYTSPLLFLAETYSRSVHDLARELGCKVEEAFAYQVKAAAELAPYLHGKMPVEIKAEGALPLLAMIPADVAAAAYKRAEDGSISVDLGQLVPFLQNQGLIDITPGDVEQAELNGEPKGQADQGDGSAHTLIEDQQA